MINDVQAALPTLADYHDMDSEDLSRYLYENFAGSLVSLKQLEKPIRDISRRFKNMPRKKKVDGTYPTIAGHRSFGAGKNDKIGWCMGVLHRDDRTVRYMLNGGNKKRKRPKGETVSVPDAVAILKYLDTYVSDLNIQQRKILAQGLPQFLTRLKRSIWTCQKRSQ